MDKILEYHGKFLDRKEAEMKRRLLLMRQLGNSGSSGCDDCAEEYHSHDYAESDHDHDYAESYHSHDLSTSDISYFDHEVKRIVERCDVDRSGNIDC